MVTIERPDPLELVHTVSVWANGSNDLLVRKDVVLSQGEAENESGSGNVLVMGTMSTDAVVAWQLDFVRMAEGVNEPGSVGPVEQFSRGDANDDGQRNIADAISILGFLFGGGAAPVLSGRLRHQ